MLSTANLEIYQGDDYSAKITVMSGGLQPDPIDLTNCSAQAQIRTGAADTDPVVAEIQTGVVLPNLICIFVPAAATVCLSGRYCWDLQLIDANGKVNTILAGAANVTREVTRVASPITRVFDPVAISRAPTLHATLRPGTLAQSGRRSR